MNPMGGGMNPMMGGMGGNMGMQGMSKSLRTYKVRMSIANEYAARTRRFPRSQPYF